MKKVIVIAIISSVAFFSKTSAQFTPNSGIPGGGSGPLGGIPGSGTDPGVPFDGGLSIILLAAGAGFGSKRVKLNGVGARV